VAFRSSATDLIGGYSGTFGVFLHDHPAGSNVLVSHVPSSLATSGNGYSERPVIGLDGAHVAFSSFASDLVDLDLNGNEDAFLFSFDCGGTSLNATANGDNRIDLAWSAPGAYTYKILRSRTPGGPYDTIGTVAGTSFVDATAQGGVTYYYVVTNACGPSNEASAATTGACQLPPDFAGAVSAMQQGGPSCQVRVDWAPATSPCGGATSYSIHRDTTPGLVPDVSNRIAAGFSGISYLDAAGILPVTSYYYVVRAMSEVNGEEEANLVEVSATPISCSPSPPAPVTFFNVRSGDSENVLDWVNPTGTFSQTHIAYTDDGSAPSCTGVPVPGSPFPGTAGARGRVAMAAVNGTTYRFAACAEGPGTGLSAPVESFGRPDSTAGNWQWSYTTGAAALTVIGVIPDTSYHLVSNDRILHALAPGGAGGSWLPLGPPDWFPFSTNAPVQGRPIVVNLPSTTVSGVSRIALIGSQDGKVYAVDAETGAQLWASPLLGASVQAAPAAMFTDFGGSYDLVLVGTREPGGDSKFYGLHLATGAIAWKFDNGGGANGMGIISGVAQVDYSNHRLYFASRKKGGGSGDTLWCLSFTSSTVNLEWSVDVGEVDGSPVLGGTRLYVGNNAGQVHAIDPVDGDFLWLAPYSTGDGPVKGFVWPHVGSGRLYFSTTTKVHAIHDDGGSASAFWTPPVAIISPSPVLLSRGRVYVGGDLSRLYSIDATSMTPPAPSSIVLGDPLVPKVVGAPVLDVLNGLMIAGSDLGVIFAVLVPF
jgi:outer membrane protein assembly factor BamB